MNKKIYRVASMLTALMMALGMFSHAQAAPQYAAFHERLALGNLSDWEFEKSGSAETITATSDGWVCQAGGNAAKTHYARIKYKLPEQTGKAPSTFYMRAVIVLPSNFYDQQQAGFRLLNTDNFGTTLNGEQFGASDTNELRTSVYIFSSHKFGIIADHQNVSKKVVYKSSDPLPVGEHVFELYGNVADKAPWYFKVDGKIIAAGTERLSPDSVPADERVVTRLNVGIDGAADQDNKSMKVLVKSFEIADYDMSGSSSQPPATTTPPTIIPPTVIPPTPVVTPTESPTSGGSPSAEIVYDDKNSAFAYSSGWKTVITKRAYDRSYKLTTKDGASVTLPFKGRSFSILYKSGKTFGKMKIYVDDKLVTTLDQKGGNVNQQRWDYSGQLTSGSHTLKLVFVPASKKQNSGSLDAVVVR